MITRRTDLSPRSDPNTLLAYIDELEGQVETLASALSTNDEIANLQHLLDLTTGEAQLLALLADGRTRSKDQILSGLYWRNSSAMPEIKIIDVWVCKIRKKIGGSGIHIETVWGSGYYATGTDVIKAAMAGQAPTWTAADDSGARMGKPMGGVGRRIGSVRDTALQLLKSCADNEGRVVITSKELSEKADIRNSGSITIRNLERSGRLNVLRPPHRRGDPWILKLAEAA